MVASIGKIKADYQPGHSHAGTFSFELSFNERFIVNNGISTYENNFVRSCERSTLSHSSVSIDNQTLQKYGLVSELLEDPKLFIEKLNKMNAMIV